MGYARHRSFLENDTIRRDAQRNNLPGTKHVLIFLASGIVLFPSPLLMLMNGKDRGRAVVKTVYWV